MKKENSIIRVLFVCLGNICRSPMAEAVFSHLVEQKGLSAYFEIQSAGIGRWHVGERPHPGTLQVLKQHGMPASTAKRAQQIQANLFESFDYVVAMDRSNQADLDAYGDAILLLDLVADENIRDVPDPYYEHNFDEVYRLVLKGCEQLLAKIVREQGLAHA